MFFTVTLYIALAGFGIGPIIKLSTWFRYRIGKDAAEISTAARVLAATGGIVQTLFSAMVFTLLKVFVLDVILQTRVLREPFLRWLMHICLYGGFMLLFLLHALDKYITAPLFSQYYSTINPFMFLRDLFGAMVIIGMALAIYRRFILRLPHLRSNAQDHYAIIVLAVIMLSGVLLEGSKIVSHTRYREMVEEYVFGADEKELNALEAYWVKEYSVVSPNIKGPPDAETLALGKSLNETSCLQCHSQPQSAFLGCATAVDIRHVALELDRAGIPNLLWYIHFLACWIGLTYLPFSKVFHILASPVSLLANAVMDKGGSAPANIATRQVMEQDACMHCGTCTARCSAGVVFAAIPNINILPSEKIASVKALVSGKILIWILCLFTVWSCSKTGATRVENPEILPGLTVETPNFKVGDTWAYANNRTRQVVEIKGNMVVTREKASSTLCGPGTSVTELLAQRDRNGTILKVTDISGKPIDECSLGDRWLEFPLYIGKKWDFSANWRTTHDGKAHPHYDRFDNQFAVESFEEVTVPAGTFKAFKIRHDQQAVGCGLSEPNGFRGTRYYWYAPEAKQAVKTEGWGATQLESYSLK